MFNDLEFPGYEPLFPRKRRVNYLMRFVLFICFIFVASIVVFAQTIGTDISIVKTGNPLMDQMIPYLLTTIVIPFLIALIKKLAPQIPGWLIPILVLIIGGMIPVLQSLVTSNTMNVWISIIVSLVAIGLRELYDQLIAKPIANAKQAKAALTTPSQ